MTTEALIQLSKNELMEMIETIVEQRLMELLKDPDNGLQLRAEVRHRLLAQQQAVAAGERGELLDDVIQQLGLN